MTKGQSDVQIHEGPLLQVELRDDLTLRGRCPKGHNMVHFLDAEKFEILFDLGIMALLDGYSREAGSSIAAAIERVHQFAIEVFLQHVEQAVFQSTWKELANDSKRQLGAFLMLYASAFGKKPPKISDKNVNLRNKMVHKGTIPTRDEIMGYARDMYQYMVNTVTELREKLADQFFTVHENDMQSRSSKISDGDVPVKHRIRTMYQCSFEKDEVGKRDFNAALETFKTWRWDSASHLIVYRTDAGYEVSSVDARSLLAETKAS
jgi:hypothetical protein